jgi:hypothetical protein
MRPPRISTHLTVAAGGGSRRVLVDGVHAVRNAGQVTETEKPPATLFTKRSYLAFWRPRMGREAAELSWRAGQERLYSFVSAWIGAGFIAAVIRTHHALWWIGVAIGYVTSTWFLIAAIRHLRATNRAMSQLFGFKVGFRADGGPPKLRAHYLRWCETHALVPFTADQ